MTSKTKSALAAALIAAFATPALAQGAAPYYYDQAQAQSSATAERQATHTRRLTEGRNAAVIHEFGNYDDAAAGRDGVVQSLGN